MTKYANAALVIFIFFTLCAFISFEFKHTENEAVAEQYLSDCQSFQKSISDFYNHITQLGNRKYSLVQLRKDFVACRMVYKSIEYLTEYYHPQFIKSYINGVPLPHLDESIEQPVEVAPEGFQVIEELLFAEQVDTAALLAKAHLLAMRVSDMQSNNKVTISDRHVFEACRIELIRIFSAGLAGLDTPGSGAAVPEAASSLKALHQCLLNYHQRIEAKDALLWNTIDNKFTTGIHYLEKNNDFDSFNRFYFLKEFINPLYGAILDAHLLLDIETWDETSAKPKSLNYYSKNIFASDFLNPDYFLLFPKEKYNAETAQLGKLLFFDPVLSANNQRSCASCHSPQKAFSDGVKKSVAMDFDGTVLRNAPTLINAVYADKFFYDMRTDRLEDQIEHVIVNVKEFHSSYYDVFERLQKSEEYRVMFEKNFPEVKKSPITTYTVSASIAAYIRSLTALNSPFDKMVRNEVPARHGVVAGFNLFMGKAGCGTCHFAPVFNGSVPPIFMESESEVLGVPATEENKQVDPDLGRYEGKVHEHSPMFVHAFKTPTIRNAALTTPYMHNGVYNTLEQVLDFYNQGGGAGLGLEVPNQTLPADKLNLTKSEIGNIISFINALTDTTGTTSMPARLPEFPVESKLNNRKIGGDY